MLTGVTIREQTTAKTLKIEPTTLGVHVFICNSALDGREHIELTRQDIKHVLQALQAHDEELDVVYTGEERKEQSIDVRKRLADICNHVFYERMLKLPLGERKQWDDVYKLLYDLVLDLTPD